MIRALLTVLVASLIVVTIGPWLLLCGLAYPSRELAARISRLWATAILRTAGVRLTIEGKEHIADASSRFFMGNHQSALDIPILVAALRGGAQFMGKDTLLRIPLFGRLLLLYGYVPVHRSQPRVTLRTLNRMLTRIREKPFSLVVFPEGTRERDGRLLPFRMGTMKIGREAGLPIVPFSIDGSMAVSHRDVFRVCPGPVRLTFSKPIPAKAVMAMSPAELHDRVHEAVLQGLGQPSSSASMNGAPVIAAEGT